MLLNRLNEAASGCAGFSEGETDHPSPEVCTNLMDSPNDKPSVFRNELAKSQMFLWVHSLAPWKVIAHHTFVWEASIWSAQKSYERFMRKNCSDVSYFYAIEQNPGRDGHHVHALWADCEGVQRREVWNRWFSTYGRNRIEPVRRAGDVAAYCAKYVTKEGAWWNVRLVDADLFRVATSPRAPARAKAS